MLRRGFIVASIVAFHCSQALAHEAAGEHGEAAYHAVPVVEVVSGLALIVAIGAFWMSLRTRRMLLRSTDGRCAP